MNEEVMNVEKIRIATTEIQKRVEERNQGVPILIGLLIHASMTYVSLIDSREVVDGFFVRVADKEYNLADPCLNTRRCDNVTRVDLGETSLSSSFSALMKAARRSTIAAVMMVED